MKPGVFTTWLDAALTLLCVCLAWLTIALSLAMFAKAWVVWHAGSCG